MPDTLLYITQVIPAPTGSGLVMRAFHVLKALSSRYSVYLLVIGRSIRNHSIASALSFCRQIHYVPAAPQDRDLLLRLLLYKLQPSTFVKHFGQPLEWGFISQRRIDLISHAFGNQHFDVVHAFRLYSAPFAEPFFSRSNFQQLDLDDIDSETRRSISRLSSENKDQKKAALNAHEAELYSEIERSVLAKWKRVFVCSSADQKKLTDMYGHSDVQVLPNVVSVPGFGERKQPDEIFRFLFIGSFHYYPNQDAIFHFCKQILPILRKTIRFQICVAGDGLTARLKRTFNQMPEVEIAGFVSDPAEVYKRSDAVIVPLRAGGGTRVKVLEAFAFQRPVISTTNGIYGIDALDEEHCLVGDTPEQFARQCTRISRDPELRVSLVKNAFDLVQNRYSPQTLMQDLLKAGIR